MERGSGTDEPSLGARVSVDMSAFTLAGWRVGWRWKMWGRSWLCHQAPPGVPLLQTISSEEPV